jgi:hypothetical protein
MYKPHLKEKDAQFQNLSVSQNQNVVNQNQFAVNQNQLVVNQSQFVVKLNLHVMRKRTAKSQCTMNSKIAVTKFILMLNKIKILNIMMIMKLISKLLDNLKHL